jgi:tetratricopeptide (TPR) repeat protein
MAKQWDRVLEHTGRVIQVYPGSFPRAYSLNAWAHLRLQHFELAEKSAMEGIRVDDEHHPPELEFVAGMALLAKHDREGATKHFEAYLALAPRGVDAALAQKQLASLHTAR